MIDLSKWNDLDPSSLHEALKFLEDNGHGPGAETYLANSSVLEALDCFLKWNGMMGYTQKIARAVLAIVESCGTTLRREMEQNDILQRRLSINKPNTQKTTPISFAYQVEQLDGEVTALSARVDLLEAELKECRSLLNAIILP